MSNDKVKLCLVGIGSSHGEDAVGWRVVEGLRTALPASVQARNLAEPTALLPLLGRFERIWIVDACRSHQPVGTVTRFDWPDERIDRGWSLSGHGVGLAEVLELAATLGHVEAKVVLFTIDVGREAIRPGNQLRDDVAIACDELQQRIRKEIETPGQDVGSMPYVNATGTMEER